MSKCKYCKNKCQSAFGEPRRECAWTCTYTSDVSDPASDVSDPACATVHVVVPHHDAYVSLIVLKDENEQKKSHPVPPVSVFTEKYENGTGSGKGCIPLVFAGFLF